MQRGQPKGRWWRLPEPPPRTISYHRERWTDAQNETLKQHYTSHGAIYTAALLGRTVVAIRSRARLFGLPGFETNTWSGTEMRRATSLFNQHGRHPGAIIARTLGRSRGSVRAWLRRQGLTIRPYRRWTERERRIVRRYCGKETARAIGERIGRSELAVLHQTHALGLYWTQPPRPWTPREDKRLRALQREGLWMVAIARVLKRTKHDVVERARTLGVLRRIQHWTAEDDEALRALVASKLPYPEIARRLGRSIGAVRAHIHLRGLGARETDRPWTTGEDRQVRKLYHKLTAADIGQRLGRSASAIILRGGKLGLARPRPARWSNDDDRVLQRMAQAGREPEEIAERLGRTVAAVKVRIGRLRRGEI